MRIVITSGPSYEPIDRVRRLSNFSSGQLGTLLAEGFAEAGHSVVCFRGVASTFPPPLYPVEVIPFTTNDDLAAGLQRLPAREEATVVLHVAALCDFKVREIVDEKGEPVHGDKVSSRVGTLKLTLEPAPKLIASLRRMFPSSILVGWKYELDGTADDVLAKGRKQIDECLTDACVLNGHAYGSGFGLISRSGEQVHLPDKAALCRFLIEWTERTPMALATPGEQSFHALSSFTSLSPFI
jgi:phosphopantothenoylcysteine decarboxylase/phosphopantothenate--cysteine ligase